MSRYNYELDYDIDISGAPRRYNYNVDENLPSYMSSYSVPKNVHGQGNKLYGNALVNLSKETQYNLNRLKEKLVQIDPCYEYGIEHWHPNKSKQEMPEYIEYPDHATPKWETTQNMFINDKDLNWKKKCAIDETSSNDSPGIASFCYLCTTLEEHQQHIAKRGEQLKPKPKRKQRVGYIAPMPYVKPKIEEIELPEEVLYKMIVKTGLKPNAATSANVFVRLQGKKGTMKKKQLKKNMSINFSFGRGTTEAFYIKTPKLGSLHWLYIEHDGDEQKHSWYLEEVEVKEVSTNETFLFPCKNWLSLYVGDGTVKRKLKAHRKEIYQTEYAVRVTTGQLPMAGTDSIVYLTMYGRTGTSPRTKLKSQDKEDQEDKHPPFHRGKTDTFHITVDDIGALNKIKIEHDNSGKKSADWLLEKIEIENLETGKVYVFPCGQWLSEDEGKGHLFRELYPLGKKVTFKDQAEVKAGKKGVKKSDKPQIDYEVITRTGDIRYAGTNANVFLQMMGKLGKSQEVNLDDEKDNFERGQTDNFKVEADDVGDIKKVTIRQDDSGLGAGWFLDTMTIRRFFGKTEVRERMMEMDTVMEEEVVKRASELTGQSISGSANRRVSMKHQKSYKQVDSDQEHRGKKKNKKTRFQDSESEEDKKTKRKGKKKGFNDSSDSDNSGMFSSLKKKMKNFVDGNSSESDSDSEYDNKYEKKKKTRKHGQFSDSEDERTKKKHRKYKGMLSDSDDERGKKKTKIIGGKRKKLFRYNGVETWVTDSESEDEYEKRKQKKKGSKYMSDSEDERRLGKNKKGKQRKNRWESESESEDEGFRKNKKKLKEKQTKGRRKSKYDSESESEESESDQEKKKKKKKAKMNDSETESDSEKEKYSKKKKKRISWKVSDSGTDSDESGSARWNTKVYKEWGKGRVPYCDEYQFVCKQWLATDEGDGQTSRTLKPKSVTTFYRVASKKDKHMKRYDADVRQ